MRVALIAHEIHDHGGMERYMAMLARWLKRQGHGVDLYTADEACPLVDEGFTWQRIPTVRRPLWLRVPLFYWQAQQRVAWGQYDIVHANGGIVPMQHVTTLHFCQPRWQSVFIELENSPAYQAARRWRLWNRKLAARVAQYFEAKAVANSHQVIAVSQLLADEAQQAYHPQREVQVIHNGVCPQTFYPVSLAAQRDALRQQLGLPTQECAFLFVGEFGRKGLHTVLQALRLLPEQSSIVLWVVGRDAEQAYYQTLVNKWGLSHRVRFLGFRTDVPDLMRAANGFVLPTCYDPFGLVITEAMASGLPVITSKEAGASELMTHLHDGILLSSPNAVTELADWIQRVESDVVWRESLALHARETACKHTWDAMAQQVFQVYEWVLQQPVVVQWI